MDFLASFNLHELPEQQTKINEGVSEALKENPDIRLGFDACCTCAKKLKLSDKSDVCCKGCKRVWYCSKECRRKDAESDMNDDEPAQGHSSIICSLCRLAQIEDFLEGNADNKITFSKEEEEAAYDRIRSEHESYPATLANVLLDAMSFQPTLARMKKERRKKTDRAGGFSARNKTFTIHIIGASEEAELWGKYDHSSCESSYAAYAEAMTELVHTYDGISTIELIFVGPDCPKKSVNEVRFIKGEKEEHQSSRDDGSKNKQRNTIAASKIEVRVQSYRCNYDESICNTVPTADIVVFFNPGFTCPDYDWSGALNTCVKEHGVARRKPFMITTNTEMEAISDLQYLHKHGYIDNLPIVVADIIDGENTSKETDFDIAEHNDPNIFFGENPNAGLRVRQSGNMANDLFVKNRWIYGGLFSGNEEVSTSSKKIEAKDRRDSTPPKPKKRSKNSALM